MTHDNELKKEMQKDYQLIAMSDIDAEARLLAVAWVEGYERNGIDLRGKKKLASDIMNYSRRKTERLTAELEAAKARVKELEDGLKELMEGVAGLPPLTAIAGVLEKQYSAAKQLLNQK